MKMQGHKSKSRLRIPVAALAGFALPILGSTSAWAQTYASERGHVLDANQRLGSLGWNTPMRLDPVARRVNFGLTGNLRFGGNFQGLVPYRSTYEFGSLLGSTTLSDFRRDSFSRADLGVRSYRQPTPYIDPSRQVTRSVDGQVIKTSQLYPTQNNRVSLSAPVNMTSSVRSEMRVLRPLNRPDFAMSIGSPFNQTRPLPPLTAAPPLPDAGYLSDDTQDPSSPGLSPLDLLARPDSEMLSEVSDEPATATPSYYQELQTRLLPETPGLADGPPSPLDEVTGQPEEPVDPETIKNLPSAKDRIITERLRNENQQLFQSQMQLGESLMKRGEYYKAANAYDIASIYQPDSPVVLLARSHALLAAGELMSSAYYLDQALLREPAFLKTKIDPRELFKDPDQFQSRMETLDRWHQRTGNQRLTFLKSYVMLQTDQEEKAKSLIAELVDAQSNIASVKLLSDHIQNLP